MPQLNHQHSNIFDRLAKVVTVRDLQRQFAFTWDVDRDGGMEIDLLKAYVARHGALSRSPVLLLSDWESSDVAIVEGSNLPWGVYYPMRSLEAYFADGKLDEEQFDAENRNGQIDSGVSFGTVDMPMDARVSADTTLLELFRDPPPKFAQTGALVLDGHRLTGVVTADDLMSPPAQMCMLAVVLELEAAAIELCRLFPKVCIESLPETRQQKARETFRHRFGSLLKEDDVSERKLNEYLNRFSLYVDDRDTAVFSLLVDCTHLSDKSRMIRKCKLTIDLSNNHVNSVFGRAEKLRNTCAHPGVDSERLPFTFDELRDLVNDMVDMTRVLKDSFDVECRARQIKPK